MRHNKATIRKILENGNRALIPDTQAPIPYNRDNARKRRTMPAHVRQSIWRFNNGYKKYEVARHKSNEYGKEPKKIGFYA